MIKTICRYLIFNIYFMNEIYFKIYFLAIRNHCRFVYELDKEYSLKNIEYIFHQIVRV